MTVHSSYIIWYLPINLIALFETTPDENIDMTLQQVHATRSSEDSDYTMEMSVDRVDIHAV
jgi:hypothetical protein